MNIPIHIDRAAHTPVYVQITDALRELVARRLLKPGDRLPTSRDLADQLDVNRTTVVSAYRAAVESGLAEATVGRGTFIANDAADRAPAAAPARGDGRHAGLPRGGFSRAIDEATFSSSRETEVALDHPDVIDFASLAPDERLFPIADLRPVFDRLLSERGTELLQYSAPQGDPDLRRYIAQDLGEAGCSFTTDDIIIVNGTQQGIDLTLRVFADPGDSVIVGSPTYMSILTSLALYRAHVVDVPVAVDGLDTRALEDIVTRRSVKLVYTMPTFQNPTGVTMSLDKRRHLVELAERHDFVILEDDFERQLRFTGEALPPLAAIDRSERVIHLGTFSKALFPGLRIGWVAAKGPVMDRLILAKRIADLHTSMLTQAAVASFCTSGGYQRHLQMIGREYAKRQQAVFRALARHLPPGTRWTEPDGGFVVWLTLPEGIDAPDVVEDAAREGIATTPGTFYFTGNRGNQHLRLSFARTRPESIDRAMKVLGNAVRRRLTSNPPARPRPARRSIPHL